MHKSGQTPSLWRLQGGRQGEFPSEGATRSKCAGTKHSCSPDPPQECGLPSTTTSLDRQQNPTQQPAPSTLPAHQRCQSWRQSISGGGGGAATQITENLPAPLKQPPVRSTNQNTETETLKGEAELPKALQSYEHPLDSAVSGFRFFRT